MIMDGEVGFFILEFPELLFSHSIIHSTEERNTLNISVVFWPLKCIVFGHFFS